jgi:hypothetical protein
VATESFDIASWDRTVSTLPSRAEQLQDAAAAAAAFTPTVFLDSLLQAKDQIVYGRRGTGKTHLFRCLEASYDPAELVQHRTIVVYVDASHLSADAYGARPLPKIVALDIFGQLVKKIAIELQTTFTTRIDPSRLERALGTGKAKQVSAARKRATLLSQLVETGEVHYLPMGEASQTTKSLHEAARDAKGRASVSFTDPHTFGVRIGASVDAQHSAVKSKLHTVTISGRLYLSFVEIAKVLRELLESVSAEHLVLIIDEWSTIDFDAQPFLAQLLKRMRQASASSSSQVHLKLGCIPTRTNLSLRVGSPIPIGLEEGDDIFPDADLDRSVYFDRTDGMSLVFMQDILQRHAGQSLPWVKALEPKEFAKFIRSHVFSSTEVFSELCWASAGVPRDFLDMMSKATREKMSRGARKITFRDVREIVRPVYEAKVKDIPASAIELNRRVYQKIVFPNRSYAEFLLSGELDRTPDVATLWVERLWHRSPERFVKHDTGKTYQRYRIDYGMYVDLVKSSKDADQSWDEAVAAASIGGAIVGTVAEGVNGILAAVMMPLVEQLLNKDFYHEHLPIATQALVDPRKLIADTVISTKKKPQSNHENKRKKGKPKRRLE